MQHAVLYFPLRPETVLTGCAGENKLAVSPAPVIRALPLKHFVARNQRQPDFPSAKLPPLLGFAAVKQEDHAQGDHVLRFGTLTKV